MRVIAEAGRARRRPEVGEERRAAVRLVVVVARHREGPPQVPSPGRAVAVRVGLHGARGVGGVAGHEDRARDPIQQFGSGLGLEAAAAIDVAGAHEDRIGDGPGGNGQRHLHGRHRHGAPVGVHTRHDQLPSRCRVWRPRRERRRQRVGGGALGRDGNRHVGSHRRPPPGRGPRRHRHGEGRYSGGLAGCFLEREVGGHPVHLARPAGVGHGHQGNGRRYDADRRGTRRWRGRGRCGRRVAAAGGREPGCGHECQNRGARRHRRYLAPPNSRSSSR